MAIPFVKLGTRYANIDAIRFVDVKSSTIVNVTVDREHPQTVQGDDAVNLLAALGISVDVVPPAPKPVPPAKLPTGLKETPPTEKK